MKSHMAIHFTDSATPRVVVQPRNKRGQFLRPARRFTHGITTMHVTLHGEVVHSINKND